MGLISGREAPQSAPSPPRRFRGGRFWEWAKRTVSSLVVTATLGGLAYWGHTSEWTFAIHPVPARDEGKPVTPAAMWTTTVVDRSSHFGAHGTDIFDQAGGPDQSPDDAWRALTGPACVAGWDILQIRAALVARPRAGIDPRYPARTIRVSFPSAEDAEKVGIEVALVGRGAVVETIPAAGVIDFDVARTTRLPGRVRGTVRVVLKGVGDRVRPGDVLALIDAADVGKAKAELLQALVQLRLRTRAKANLAGTEGVVSEQRQRESAAALTDAEVRVRTAEQALVNLGLPARADELKGLDTGEAMKRLRFLGLPDGITTAVESVGSANLLPVVATTTGTILAATAVVGEIADPIRPLFTVTDTGVADVTLFLLPAEVPLVRLGMSVHFTPDGLTDTFVGTLSWVGTAADERSRRVPVRGEFDNAGARLRDSALGGGGIVLRTEPFAVLVPAAAVRAEGGCQYVFVRDPGEAVAYSARPVLLGAPDGRGNVEVVVGVTPGELVVTKGATFLVGELQTTQTNQPTGGGR